MHVRLPSTALAVLTAVAVALVPATAASASVQDSREEVQQAREEVAQLGREVEAAAAEYEEVEARLAEQEARAESAGARAAAQARTIARIEDELVVMAVEAYKLGGVDPKLQLLASGSLDMARSTDELGVVAGRKGASLDTLREAQVELERLRAEEQASLAEVEALEAELVERRAAIEKKLDGAKDALAVAEREHRARVAAEQQRQAELAASRARDERAAADAELQAQQAGAATLSDVSGSGGGMAMPASGPITSPFGWRTHPVYGDRRFHKGIDVGASCGTPVVAARSGSVTSASWHGSYGNIIVVEHGDGLSTAYAHLQGFATGGGSVERGQVIGYVGTTGLSTGCHLHFEVRQGGEPVNPMGYL
ncbi:peptidoglycan DD-metalloendopeptidase family protein [Aquipuribacter sp. SD81]|uniref:peptidoglycan DD-metalloendopeptidase family protein n=1 Tax=Aquipuribacter sp. SD81 TaxID=3127703 RepID=UPI003016A4A6